MWTKLEIRVVNSYIVQVEPPLKKFERNGRKTYVALVSMEQDYMER